MQIHHIIPKKIIEVLQNPDVKNELLCNNDFLIELPCSEQEAKIENCIYFTMVHMIIIRIKYWNY